MRRPRLFLNTVLGVSSLAAACTGEQALPNEPGQPSYLLGALDALLLQCSPQPYTMSTAVIGPMGGTLVVGSNVLVVAPNALSQPVSITGEVVTGSVNSIRFSPEGLRFNGSGTTLTMSYSNCSGLGMLLPKKVAYTNELLSILEILNSLDLSGQRQVIGQLKHFSRYAVAY